MNERVRFWLVVLLVLLFLRLLSVAAAQRSVPLATEADHALAPLAVSLDGKEITVRAQASDNLRVCVEPRAFGRRHCFTVGEVRRAKEIRFIPAEGR